MAKVLHCVTKTTKHTFFKSNFVDPYCRVRGSIILNAVLGHTQEQGVIHCKAVRGCAIVMTSFFMPFTDSALLSLPINHQCIARALPFSIFIKNAFSALFWPKYWLTSCKFSKFLFPIPLMFQGKFSFFTQLLKTCGTHTDSNS